MYPTAKVKEYMAKGFPPGIRKPDGNDDVCRLCGEWCTSKSSCSSRYHIMTGSWVDRNQEQASVPVCDVCYETYDLDNLSGTTINVADQNFTVDVIFREND